MTWRRSVGIQGWGWGLALFLLGGAAWAEIRWEDLEVQRAILERDWLQVKLEVLGLRLSYPAYRIQIGLDADNRIAFSFLASEGLAEYLTEKAGRAEAEKVLSYHAEGIRRQIERLLKEEFPSLWSGFDAETDFEGRFMGPGEKWDDPPRVIGLWKEGRFLWK